MYKLVFLIFGNPLHFIEFLTIGIFLLCLITQLIIPLIQDRPIFPIFSRKPKLNRQIRDVNEKIDEADLEAKLKKTQVNLKSKQKENSK